MWESIWALSLGLGLMLVGMIPYNSQKCQSLLNKKNKRKHLQRKNQKAHSVQWQDFGKQHYSFTQQSTNLRIWLYFTLMSNQTNFSWVIPLNDLSSICVMGCLILPQDHLIWHCQNMILAGTGDRAPPLTATSLPALMSPTKHWGRGLQCWCKPWVTSDLKSLKICAHHISQEEVASAEHLG